jgi:hypothetical protein
MPNTILTKEEFGKLVKKVCADYDKFIGPRKLSRETLRADPFTTQKEFEKYYPGEKIW